MRSRRSVLGAVVLSSVLVLAPSARAQTDGTILEDRKFLANEVVESFSAQTRGVALRIFVEGLGELTLSGGNGASTFEQTTAEQAAPKVPTDLFTACDQVEAVNVAGTKSCLDENKLEARGFDNPPSPVSLTTLVERGIAEIVVIDTIAKGDQLAGQSANADSAGLIIPNLAQGTASCEGTAQQSATGLSIPDPLTAVLAGDLGIASCDTVGSGFPSVTHGSGEADLAVTLNNTLIDNVPLLNDALDTIQDQLAPLGPTADPVNSAIDAIQAELTAEPLLTISVAPSGGAIVGSGEGFDTDAQSVAVTLSVLGGILEVTVGTAEVEAAILDRAATADAGSTFASVRALNILTPDPDDTLIDQEIQGPSQDLPILEGTLLESLIRIGAQDTAITNCPASGGGSCSALASASTLSIDLFRGASSALPNIQIELAAASAEVGAVFAAQANLPDLPVLPRTGAAALPTLFLGGGLVGLAAIVRRRFGV